MTAQAVLPVVPETQSLPGRALLLLDRCTMAALLVTVGTMVAVVAAQVVLRYGFAGSLDWSDEISRLTSPTAHPAPSCSCLPGRCSTIERRRSPRPRCRVPERCGGGCSFAFGRKRKPPPDDRS